MQELRLATHRKEGKKKKAAKFFFCEIFLFFFFLNEDHGIRLQGWKLVKNDQVTILSSGRHFCLVGFSRLAGDAKEDLQEGGCKASCAIQQKHRASERSGDRLSSRRTFAADLCLFESRGPLCVLSCERPVALHFRGGCAMATLCSRESAWRISKRYSTQKGAPLRLYRD